MNIEYIFLWRHSKMTAYESNPHTIQELNHHISHTAAPNTITTLHRLYLNMNCRAQLCTDARDKHFPTSSMTAYPFSIWLLYSFPYLRHAMDQRYFFVDHSVLSTQTQHLNTVLSFVSLCYTFRPLNSQMNSCGLPADSQMWRSKHVNSFKGLSVMTYPHISSNVFNVLIIPEIWYFPSPSVITI